MYFGITDLSTFILGTIFIVLLPGPNSLYVMTIASRFGINAGYRAAGGIVVGDLILMVLSASGVASLLQTSPAVFMVLKYAGAIYLVWLGVGLLRSAMRSWRGRDEHSTVAIPSKAPSKAPTKAPADISRPFRTALLICMVNPKAILFFVSFFIQFVLPDYPYPALSFLILGAIAQLCSVIYLSALIFGGMHLADVFRRRQRLAATATGGVGGLFVGFGLRLAYAT